MENKIAKYQEIIDALDANKDVIKDDPAINIIDRLKDRINVCKVQQKFGIPCHVDSSPTWIKFSDYQVIGLFGEKYSRTISCSDNGEQPEYEYLYRLSFPSGPYIFFRYEYLKDLFVEFFNELKTYGPKYCDTKNNTLYFSSDNAKKIHDDFNDILKKYREKVKPVLDKLKAERLRAELEKIKSTL